MSTTWKLILFYALIIILLAVFMPRQLDWTPSFSLSDSNPYGGEAIHGTLTEIFNVDISTVDEPLYNVMRDTSYSRTNYLLITDEFYLDSLDLSALYEMVENGNNAFIAAEEFNREFLDSLGLVEGTHFNDFFNAQDLRSVETDLYIRSSDTAYAFKSQWSNTFLQVPQDAEIQPLGIGLQDTAYNYVRIPFGEGAFFIHSFPFALTNYYLMKEETRHYISAVFSQLPVDYDVVWDEYYKPNRGSSGSSSLSVLMRFRSFKWVYWLTISGLLLYMFFYAKRQQRPIPIINPPRNESLRFAQTLGGLYYNKGSHKDIFTKKVKVFREFLSSHYYMKDLTWTASEAEILKRKSGRDSKLIDYIFKLAREYENLEALSDGQLKAIVKKINEFYADER